jgi:sugar phosphate isomerase/epimerase
MRLSGGLDLTYCTNIHPGNGWEEVSANVRRFAPALKRQLSPGGDFGLGLRLSAREARELLEGGRLADFRSFLEGEGIYVALLNGFPHGSFHGAAVKANVYAPDWREEARVDYTLDLIAILAALLPEEADGGVSTAPLSYKPWMQAAKRGDWEIIVHNLTRVAEALVRVRRDHGKFIHLDIEPEPDCLIEDTPETIEFYQAWLLPAGAPLLAAELGTSAAEARELLLDHIQLCFDCCHFAVEYEDPLAAIGRFAREGIRVGRVQLSSALEVQFPDDPAQSAEIARRLGPFADTTYLHQVTEKRGDRLRRFPDLADALRHAAEPGARQWRIHFHVPLFTKGFGPLGSTQDYVGTAIEAARRTPFTRHLEIETYTWDVLPDDLKTGLADSIAREYNWALEAFSAASI